LLGSSRGAAQVRFSICQLSTRLSDLLLRSDDLGLSGIDRSRAGLGCRECLIVLLLRDFLFLDQ
jgi:hypothetical protein